MNPPLEREVFRPSGKFSLLGLAWAVPLLVAITIALSFGMALLGYTPFSLLLVVPGTAGALLGWIGLKLLRQAHCRSRGVSWLLGFSLGALMYLGHFQAAFVLEAGPAAIPHLEVWPQVVAFQVNNWVIGKPGAQQNGNPVPVINWGLFAIELGLASFFSGMFMGEAPARGYCERCNKWMSTKQVKLATKEAARVVYAIGSNTFEELSPLAACEPKAQEYALLEVEGCLHGGDGSDANFYLTAKEGVFNKDKKQTEMHDVIKQLQLTPDELLLLAEKCPGLM
jgi:hypothetical protein